MSCTNESYKNHLVGEIKRIVDDKRLEEMFKNSYTTPKHRLINYYGKWNHTLTFKLSDGSFFDDTFKFIWKPEILN